MTGRRSLITLVIVLLAFAATVLAWDSWVFPTPAPSLVAAFRARVPDAARAQFMGKIVEFSNTGLFWMRSHPLSAEGKQFLTLLDGDDVTIEIINPSYPPSDFQIRFYASDVRPADHAELARLAQRLQSDLGDVTGVTIEQRP